MNIPLYQPRISQRDINFVTKVLKRGVLSRGTETSLFEEEFASYVGKKYAISVSSGTAGLHLLVRAMEWGSGDEVITTPFSFIATANVLLYERVNPVFVDIDETTYNIDSRKVEAVITPNTKGILIPHIFGLSCDPELKKIAKKYQLPLIEDNCEAIAPKNFFNCVNDMGVGSVYSFFCNKPLTTGEGGMIVTDSAKIYKFCQSLKDQGRSDKKDWLNHVNLGYNYRMTEMQAALGRSQLGSLSKHLKERIKIAKTYNKLLRDVPGLNLPSVGVEEQRSWFIYFITFLSPDDRKRIQNVLHSHGITSHVYFPSIHTFSYFRKMGWKKGDFPISESVSERTLALPFYTDLKIEHMSKIVKLIKGNMK